MQFLSKPPFKSLRHSRVIAGFQGQPGHEEATPSPDYSPFFICNLESVRLERANEFWSARQLRARESQIVRVS
jgi:hypothetical protein